MVADTIHSYWRLCDEHQYRSLAGIAGWNLTGSMAVSYECCVFR